MSLTLNPHVENLIRQKVASGLYATADEAVVTALQRLDEHDRAQRLRVFLSIAEEQTREGRIAEWTPELQAKLRRAAEERIRRGELPSLHVRP